MTKHMNQELKRLAERIATERGIIFDPALSRATDAGLDSAPLQGIALFRQEDGRLIQVGILDALGHFYNV